MLDTVGKVVFFISTGRCGTQWLSHTLREVYSDLAKVEHEPIGFRYKPKRFLRAYGAVEEYRKLPEIDKHIETIWQCIDDGRSYIETGWPCYPAIPMFVDEFGDRIKLVHLVRHPVPTAISLMTHNLYAQRLDVEESEISPFDPGVVQKHYSFRWSKMSPFEKCLFWWGEVHLYGQEIKERFSSTPYFFIRFEDMMDASTNALTALVRHLDLPIRPALHAAVSKPVDRHSKRTDQAFDWKEVVGHLEVLRLANAFGYDIGNVDSKKIKNRYFRSSDRSHKLWRRVIRKWKRF